MDLCRVVLTIGQAVGIGKAWILSIGYGLPCISMDACQWIAVDLCGNQRKCVTVTFDFMGQPLESDGSHLNELSWTLMDCLGLA